MSDSLKIHNQDLLALPDKRFHAELIAENIRSITTVREFERIYQRYINAFSHAGQLSMSRHYVGLIDDIRTFCELRNRDSAVEALSFYLPGIIARDKLIGEYVRLLKSHSIDVLLGGWDHLTTAFSYTLRLNPETSYPALAGYVNGHYLSEVTTYRAGRSFTSGGAIANELDVYVANGGLVILLRFMSLYVTEMQKMLSVLTQYNPIDMLLIDIKFAQIAERVYLSYNEGGKS